MSGAGLAAISAYNEFVPWWLDMGYEANKVFSIGANIEISGALIEKSLLAPDSLSEDEKALLKSDREVGFLRVQEMIRKAKIKKEVGYDEQSRLSHQRMSSSFKSFLYFCRTLQDAIYRIGLNIRGCKAGAHSSMMSAFEGSKLKNNGAVFNILNDVSGYDNWFLEMRDKRNQVKKGVGGHFVGPYPNLGIGLPEVTSGGEVSSRIHGNFCINDVIYALEVSAALLERVFQEIEAKA